MFEYMCRLQRYHSNTWRILHIPLCHLFILILKTRRTVKMLPCHMCVTKILWKSCFNFWKKTELIAHYYYSRSGWIRFYWWGCESELFCNHRESVTNRSSNTITIIVSLYHKNIWIWKMYRSTIGMSYLTCRIRWDQSFDLIRYKVGLFQ